MIEQLHIPEAFVNVPKLRDEALALSRINQSPVSLRERVVIGIIVNRCGAYRSGLLDLIRQDVLGYEIPKYTALVAWLASYGLVSTYPNAITQVALYLLGHTRAQVEATINWDAVRTQYPQL